MKCELCHKADAETVLGRGTDKELYVCKACEKAARTKKKRQQGDAKGDSPQGVPPPPVVDAFFKATMGFVSELENLCRDISEAPKACPKCGKTWDEMEKSGVIGCPECWKIYADRIANRFLQSQFARRHVGSMPPDTCGPDAREYLEREIAAAVKREDYKTAAELKRRLDAAGGGEGGGK